jgi:redox-sensitive bicupin YhaK (pirin superfamily)
MAVTKKVKGIYGAGSDHWVGDGFPVRNLFPSNGVNNEVNPFLMLDYAGPSRFEPSTRAHGVGQHPHRGFETVTIAYQGSVSHRDSAGNAGTIYPGDVQWMTAASGVVHEEMHAKEFSEKGGTFEMVQLWVNLPKAVKMSVPRYQGITKEQIPTVTLGANGQARIIAGELHGAKGPATTFTAINVFDLRLKANDPVKFALPDGHNAAVVLLQGDVVVNGAEGLKGAARIAVLSDEGEGISIEPREDSTLLILSGEPIDEPVASYGPFVMNTEEELKQAFLDYRTGKMGNLN